jgi:hypothetical protein
MNERRVCGKLQVDKTDEGREGGEIGSFVGIGDAYFVTNTQSVAIQAGVNVQHVIETAAVGFGYLPTCVTRLDVIIGASLRARLR